MVVAAKLPSGCSGFFRNVQTLWCKRDRFTQDTRKYPFADLATQLSVGWCAPQLQLIYLKKRAPIEKYAAWSNAGWQLIQRDRVSKRSQECATLSRKGFPGHDRDQICKLLDRASSAGALHPRSADCH